MLSHLRISNFALIEKLDLEWQPGFTTITGETGAGKSIMLGALNHLLGQRADLKALKNDKQKCIIEGYFKLDPHQFKVLFEDLDLDFDEESIIRREILPSGKSRAFVNDSPVRLDVLQSLSQHLIDIHSQHDTLLLNDTGFQLKLIDSFGNHQKSLAQYQRCFKDWSKTRKVLSQLEQEMRDEGGDLDYLEFLHKELTEARLIPGEAQELEEKLALLEHSEKIESALARVSELSEASPLGLQEMLSQVRQELNGIARYDERLASFAERGESLLIEFNDLRQEIETYSADSQFDPQEKDRLDTRFSQLIHLQRKHQVEQVEGLIARRDEIEAKMTAADQREQKYKDAQSELKRIESELSDAAEKLHQARLKLKPKLESEILKLLAELNLADARFEIEFESISQFELMGRDKVSFKFSANLGRPLQELHKVASGGELSRVMLALKAILARSKSLPTIIFDEIDTGVSGETALKIGAILKDMGKHMQVISITHLAQIAAKGERQYLVKKESREKSTRSDILVLDEQSRLKEIARLLGGDQISDAALANARELIQAN